jgi:cytochrome bd-type quinol oxidase subunit 2
VSQDSASNAPSATVATTTTTQPEEGRRWRGTAVLAVIGGVVVVLLIGWLISGMPGLKGANVLNVVLLLVAIISGGLTVIYVTIALRKIRLREQAKVRDMVVVLMASLITAGVALVEMIQALQQLPR